MTAEEYIDKLDEMYYSYFDLFYDKEIAGFNFDLYGFCQLENERYVATRSIKIWQYSDYEHCLVTSKKEFTAELLQDKFFDQVLEELVEVHPGHHQTYITYVQIVDSALNPKEIMQVKDFKYSRSYWLGIRGWCDVRVIVVDLEKNKLYVNKEGEEVAENYLFAELTR